MSTPLPSLSNGIQPFVPQDNWKERVWMKAFGTILSIAVLFNGYASFRTTDAVEKSTKVQKDGAETVAKKLERADDDRKAKFDKLQKTSDSTLIQVNSNMLVTLKLLRESSRQLAELTKDPIHIKAAEDADKEVKAHEEAQRTVDKQERRASDSSEAGVNENVKDVKKGVGKLQKDVTVIKDEVTKGVKEGVKQGIEEVKKKDDTKKKSCAVPYQHTTLAV